MNACIMSRKHVQHTGNPFCGPRPYNAEGHRVSHAVTDVRITAKFASFSSGEMRTRVFQFASPAPSSAVVILQGCALGLRCCHTGLAGGRRRRRRGEWQTTRPERWLNNKPWLQTFGPAPSGPHAVAAAVGYTACHCQKLRPAAQWRPLSVCGGHAKGFSAQNLLLVCRS